jgi:hypothetical protein
VPGGTKPLTVFWGQATDITGGFSLDRQRTPAAGKSR